MGRGGETEKRGSGEVVKGATTVSEVPSGSSLPLYEIPGWRERYGVTAGITGRGSSEGRGFDLGLWSNEPVGEVMSRWLAFRRQMVDFDAIVLGNQAHGVEVMKLDAGRGWMHIEGIDGWVTRRRESC